MFFSFECFLHVVLTVTRGQNGVTVSHLGNLHYSNHSYTQCRSNSESNQSCVQYVRRMERIGAERLGLSAGHCTTLWTVGWGNFSGASHSRRRLGTFCPWPMFFINPDNVLLRLYFSGKRSLSSVICSPLPCKCGPASKGNNSLKVKTAKGGNITLTRFKQWVMPAKRSAWCDKHSGRVLWDPEQHSAGQKLNWLLRRGNLGRGY